LWGERAKVVAVTAGSGKAGGPPRLSIFLQVSSRRFELRAGKETSEDAGLAAGRVKVTEG
jgi:hypothetical protein